ncbi:T9SS type A sorting domain-containing protein [Ferruginibacter albus]|uniref:T9SS type A sorting domain-containing protein n=1 Tax=Ferruginibacter albus TaxID=2875540 RepID=UPI001CC5FE81|nr:T9SS type A sorting domain-containing protein [Ferruginibacter albus]UAY52793.1 T9SS type A sorting domain-containing protein [Ferruginibacter albus]
MKKRLRLITKVVFFFLFFHFAFACAYAQHNPLIGSGNSYVNLSKKTTGGFIQVGDTLEIRTNYFFGSSYNSGNSGNLYNIRYYDSIPLKTTILTNDSLRLITNEGLTSRRYTYAGGDDAGTYTASPGAGQYQIRINMGTNALKSTSPGSLTDTIGSRTAKIGTTYPRLFSGLLITTSFKVVVTGSPGDTIVLGIGKLLYKKTSSGSDTTINATPYKILISGTTASTLCGNALSNNLAAEKKGTFDSGTVTNRSYGLSFSIPNYSYVFPSASVSTGDGSYAIVNNLSPIASTATNSRYATSPTSCSGAPAGLSCSNRMFTGFWDIIGDHTGTNNSIGNGPVASGTKGGYMLSVNSDVVTSEAYNQTVTGLCPSTYYEFSGWVRNVCKYCGIDSASNQTYKPGVLPNLSFSINGIDIYASGQLDTIGWQKKGFVFQTSASQTSAVISIRNNASGGGGNDWVLDDISIGTCGPTATMNYTPFLLGCSSGTLANLSATIKYTYNPNYSYYVWQKSTNGGTTWTNTATKGTMTPTMSSGYYQYTTNYPSFMAYGADSGTYYRVLVASSDSNLLSNSCSFTDGNTIMLKIIDCGGIVKSDLLSFKGQLNSDNRTTLNWNVTSEDNLSKYEIERSGDGRTFVKIGEVSSYNSNKLTAYSFNDEEPVNGNIYYRLKIVDTKGLYKYSNIIIVSKFLNFEVRSLKNPFKDLISADVIMPADGEVTLYLHDTYGRLIQKKQQKMFRGLNTATIGNLDNLSKGIYTLLVEYDHQTAQKKLIKVD